MAKDKYACSADDKVQWIEAPDLAYLPRDPKSYHPKIALVGCGGIVPYHLAAYKRAGYDVAAMCDIDIERARAMCKEYYPDAAATDDYQQILERDDIEVLDIATHPEVRTRLIEDALKAGKHVLSQKPFVTDLDVGERLVKSAKDCKCKLAVNQNGRWAPHFSYIRQAINQGLIGEVMAAHLAVHWDHGWTADTVFNEIDHLILYDFAIHWCDMLCCIMGGREPRRVYATRAKAPGQRAKPPLLAQIAIEYDNAQATLVFDGAAQYGPHDSTIVLGTKGGIRSSGPDLSTQEIVLHTEAGYASPKLKGEWFVEGFHGTMAELLLAIEEDREPSNSAANNLNSLALCFAAVASAEDGVPKAPGKVRKMPM